jgi:hypothetical protein
MSKNKIIRPSDDEMFQAICWALSVVQEGAVGVYLTVKQRTDFIATYSLLGEAMFPEQWKKLVQKKKMGKQ